MTQVGVVGLGYWGSKVVEEYVALRDDGKLEKVVACDIDEEKFSSLDGIDQCETDLSKTIDTVDALHVCTSNDSHKPIATQAMDAGLDVLVEKPLAVSTDQAFDMVEHASETGQVLQTGHIFRFANVVKTLRELITDDYFGDVYYYDLAWTHRIEPRFAEGVTWDLLTHPTDILNFLTGSWPTVIGGTVESYRADVAESAEIHLKDNESDIRANVSLSWVDPVRRREVRVVGEQRSAVAHCADQQLEIYEGDSSFTYDVEPNNTIRTEAENFLNTIETRENKFNSAIVGARAVQVIEEAESVLHEE
jgi:UDP-N-acetylglucosamine 3-dehydrogenase